MRADPPTHPTPVGPLARNTVLNLLGRVVPLTVALVAVPVAVDGLGMARFGVLALAWLLLDYVNVFDFGLGKALTWAVAAGTARGETDSLGELAWTAGGLQLMLGIVGGVTLAAVTPLLTDTVLNVPAELVAESRTAFFILASVVPLLLVYRSAVGVLEGLQRFDLVNRVRIPFGSATYALAGVAGWLGWGLPLLIALLVVTRVMALVVLVVLCARTVPWVLPVRRPRERAVRVMAGYGGWVTVSSVVSPVLVYVERFLIGAFQPVAAVGLYTPAAEVVRRFLILPGSLTQAVFPAISGLAGGSGGRLAVLFARSFKYILLAMGLLALPLGLFAEPLLVAWLGPAFSGNAATALRILSLGLFVNSLAYLPYVTLEGMGRPDLPARFQMLELPLYVAVAIPAIGAAGIVGAAWVWVLRVAVDAVLLYAAALPRIQGIGRALFQERGVHAGVLLAAVGAVLMGASAMGIPQAGLALVVVGVELTAVTLAWRAVLSDAERAMLRRLFRRTGRDAGL